MAIRDYWIYQKRQNPDSQWAIYVVKEYGTEEGIVLDVTFYSDAIDNKTHTKSFVGWKSDTLRGFLNMFLTELMEFSEVDSDDMDQLDRELLRILR